MKATIGEYEFEGTKEEVLYILSAQSPCTKEEKKTTVTATPEADSKKEKKRKPYSRKQPKKQYYWTKAEDKLLRHTYAEYKQKYRTYKRIPQKLIRRLCRQLPHRSRAAITIRAQKIGVVRHR